MRGGINCAKVLAKSLKNIQSLQDGLKLMKKSHAQEISLTNSVQYMQGQTDLSKVPSVIQPMC